MLSFSFFTIINKLAHYPSKLFKTYSFSAIKNSLIGGKDTNADSLKNKLRYLRTIAGEGTLPLCNH